MKKTFYFLIIIFIIGIASTAYLFLTRHRKYPQNQTKPVATQPKMPSSDSGKITIKTEKGDVSVNNIEKDPVQKIAFDDSVVFRKTDDYEMSYYPTDQGFIITLQNSDLTNARTAAEKDFIDALGISQEQSCFLKVTLNGPFDVSQAASGRNYGLSFCSNGKPLPKK
jgi:hypothetical protein